MKLQKTPSVKLYRFIEEINISKNMKLYYNNAGNNAGIRIH